MEKKKTTEYQILPVSSAKGDPLFPSVSSQLMKDLYATVPSKQLIDQLNKLSTSIATVDLSAYSQIAKSISTLELPDISKYQLDIASKLSSGELQKAADIYNTNLQIIKNQKRPNLDLKEKVDEMTVAVLEIESVLNSQYLKGRIHENAFSSLADQKNGLSAGFCDPKQKDAAVLAVDIRRSTELMLKAKDPLSFAEFITELTNTFKSIITENNGVFDKFTGDGILSYFPNFFSGQNPMGNAVISAIKCHDAFKKIYQERRSLFSTVLVDTGLGIGIDYGGVNIVTVNDEITVVGRPVVYACRLSGAPAGYTLVNQGAFDQCVIEKLGIIFEETNIDIKHEGKICVRKVISVPTMKVISPNWRNS